MLKSHMLRVKIPDFSIFQRLFRENSVTYLNKSVLFKGFKHMLREPSTQMLRPAKNPVLRCLMGDMLNGGAPVYSLYSSYPYSPIDLGRGPGRDT